VIIFGISVAEKVRNHRPPHLSSASALPREIRNPEERTGALCVQHSPTAAALSTSFLLNHAPFNGPELRGLVTRRRESYSSVSMSREPKRWKKSSSWLNSGNALIQHLSKNAIVAFP